MVRRLLQGLDQVVPVLWIYRPEGTFTYALKERKKEEEREGERCYWKCYQVPQSKLQTRCRGSRHRAQSSEPDLYTQARIPPGDDAWRNDYYYISFAIALNISLPLCSKKEKKKSGELFSD